MPTPVRRLQGFGRIGLAPGESQTVAFAGPADRLALLVKSGSDDPLMSVHAARNADGGLSAELVTKDPDNASTVNLDYAGWIPSEATPTVYTYGDEATSITTAQEGIADTQVVPPYSIVTLKLRPSPADPIDTALTAPGSPTWNSFTAHNPQPGTSHWLGQRIHRGHLGHRHRAQSDRRLDTRLQLSRRHRIRLERLERHLRPDRPGRCRHLPGMEREPGRRQRQHGQHRVRRRPDRSESAARVVHSQRHCLHHRIPVLNDDAIRPGERAPGQIVTKL